MEALLTRLAGALAAALNAGDPHGTLARRGVTLRTHRGPLRLPGRQVFGAWDPLLRRIDLYSCDESRSDAALVGTLGHELGHLLADEIRYAAGRRLSRSAELREDAAAQRFAALWLGQLGPARVRRCAGALRSRAEAAESTGVPPADANVSPITVDLGQ